MVIESSRRVVIRRVGWSGYLAATISLTWVDSPAVRLTRISARPASLASAVIAGCQVYDPSLVTQGGSRRPPPRPDADTEGPDGPELVIGLHEVVLDPPGQEWRETGFDVDSTYTRPPEYRVSCNPRGGAMPQIDGVDGIDNVFGSDFYTLVSAATSDLQTSARESQEVGRGALMLRVIGEFGKDRYGQQLFVPDAGKSEAEVGL